ncbi:uncharacterized protein A1O9_11955 [Exophiala aquamarina CBS 119918]|uniref:Amidohydrolase-related domain-containing protein n=1 Tax=Exophiala aquamarina CBS 119918 TaxID=1182545 RepID=A0A072P8Q9_9EURO|nr:uncharacterized protein A1O9_11955 [Exophiala aquamarina CBS 119918]KEF51965.1 hypothetical protein A1O9_11955 [Exophiala aquamarina CBS 119918]
MSSATQDNPSLRQASGIHDANGIKVFIANIHDAGKPRRPWESVHFDNALRSPEYEIKVKVGTVSGFDVLVENPKFKIVKGRGRTLRSGLGDAHTHLSWNSGDIPALTGLGVKEHTLLTPRAAKIAISSGYTMCFGAASAQDRLDVAIRDVINAGKLPGPRYLANCKEITHPQDAVGQNGLVVVANGPEEMRAAVNRHIDLGADQVKMTMLGEEICEPLSSGKKCYFDDEEIAYSVDVVFYASWTDN